MDFNDWYATKRNEIIKMREFLNKEQSADANILDAVLEVGRVYLARSVEIMATAERYYILARGEAIKELLAAPEIAKTSPLLIAKLADAEAGAEKELYTSIERMNACLTHSIDVWRSRLSFHKEDMKQNGGR